MTAVEAHNGTYTRITTIDLRRTWVNQIPIEQGQEELLGSFHVYATAVGHTARWTLEHSPQVTKLIIFLSAKHNVFFITLSYNSQHQSFFRTRQHHIKLFRNRCRAVLTNYFLWKWNENSIVFIMVISLANIVCQRIYSVHGCKLWLRYK